jgi:hypothetical protein
MLFLKHEGQEGKTSPLQELVPVGAGREQEGHKERLKEG